MFVCVIYGVFSNLGFSWMHKCSTYVFYGIQPIVYKHLSQCFIVDHRLQYMIALIWQANSCWSSDLGLVLRSYFTVVPCLIQCITGSKKFNYRGEERKMCVLYHRKLCQLEFSTGACFLSLALYNFMFWFFHC